MSNKTLKKYGKKFNPYLMIIAEVTQQSITLLSDKLDFLINQP